MIWRKNRNVEKKEKTVYELGTDITYLFFRDSGGDCDLYGVYE